MGSSRFFKCTEASDPPAYENVDASDSIRVITHTVNAVRAAGRLGGWEGERVKEGRRAGGSNCL